jgi:hypothetical protein
MNPLRIFGVEHHPHLEIVAPPTEELCCWCEESFLEGEVGFVMDQITHDEAKDSFWHRECLIRNVMGSVAHQRKECSCFGGEGEDDSSLTKREAAKAAYEESEKEHGEGS